MLNSIPFEELSDYSKISIANLKEKTYADLERMVDQMRKEKAEDEQKRNFKDQEYARIIRKFFTPYDYLRHWFSDSEIMYACSMHASSEAIVEEQPVLCGNRCCIPTAEYIGVKVVPMPIFLHGRMLAEQEDKKCDIYRIPNRYQGCCHGKIILELLYRKYPQLKPFQFSAYSWGFSQDLYEIYPANQVYTPFKALMEGDIKAIKERNLSYGKSYNYGDYTFKKVQERLSSEEVQRYFSVIQNLPR